MAWYDVDSLTINTGSIAWGTIARTTTDDGNKLGLNEEAAEPGFDYEFVFESIPGTVSHFRPKMVGYYEGSSIHIVKAYAWNYHFSYWSELGTIPNESSDQTYEWATLDTANWSSGGQAKIKIVHETYGIVGHYLRIDQLILEDMTPTTAPPTTVPPTTAVPTTTITTGAPPTTVAPTSPIPPTSPPPVTTVLPTTVVPTTMLTTEAPTTPPIYDHDNDVTFNCEANNYAGIPILEISISGNVLEDFYEMDDLELVMEISISGEVPSAAFVDADELTLEMSINGSCIVNREKANWVAWSKIGDVDMILDRLNEAGRRPMAWPGFVYQTLQIDKNVAIYGSGGITVAFPTDSPAATFGFKDVSRVGIKNKTAVCGDKNIHYFVDILGCLCKFSTQGLEKFGYEEFLLPLTNPTMSWDEAEQRLYISDASTGYIFNESILTGGYALVNGLYRVYSDLKLVAPSESEHNPVAICTDVLDFKHSGLKSIESVHFDCTSPLQLWAAIDYRYDRRQEFKTSPWTQLNKEGVASIRVAAVEFRIRLKSEDYEPFDLSKIAIQLKFIDQRFTRDPKGPLDAY